ncbi:MAG: hypothetical protein ABIB97_02355 [Patescibacteria group bacterium]
MITKIISWLFGLVVLANGLLNLFRGNDPGLGVAFLLLSLVYFPPLNVTFQKKFGLAIPPVIKIILAIIIIWITLAVGALAEIYL